MLWVLCSVLAMLAGLVFFSKLQTNLPPELEFLKGAPATAKSLEAEASRQSNMSAFPLTANAPGWSLRSNGNATEVSKDFDQAITGPGGQVYDKPAFSITCYQGGLYAGVNTRLHAAGSAPIAFEVSGLPAWTSAPNQLWYSNDAVKTIGTLETRGRVSVRITFDEMGTQKFTFDTTGISAARHKLSGCKF